MHPLPPPASLEAIRAEIARGNKIEAIKKVREATGSDLKQAKEIVERLEAGRTDAEAFSYQAEPFSTPANAHPEVVAAILAGRKIEAIGLYRKATGCELVDAKEAVDRLAAGLPGSQQKKGCLVLLLASLVPISLLFAFAIAD